ncbi:ribonuclease H-like domain-containing protein [Natronobacterium texcoconense]|uniref:Helix-hairpin-helix domain-containing protein n=1 Tax=Natronobacterium texcoconense TaxID=1095778 RepID=A0A1H1FB77_NATTX|nr:ribonuclease H-like domain-containing protein [Natronobacterium texcoconense]SDQ98088.1 Helix-hairpin-helix domain-containing protein [Natronobacterium texcoconense]
MTAGSGVTLLSVQCETLAERSDRALEDLLTYFGPDLVYVVRDGFDPRVASRLRRSFDGSVVHAAGAEDLRTETVAGQTVVFATATTALEDRAPAGADYVVCDDLTVETDRISLEVGLEGRDAIGRYQARIRSAETTFLTGALEANYDHVWTAIVDGERVRLPVRGLGPIRRAGSAELACLTCGEDGSVAVSSVPADRFGLTALEGVGPSTADRLREQGYDRRAAVAEASVDDLESVRGIGTTTARTIRESARALVDGRVVRRTEDPVPPADRTPIFVDIETDGLHPTVVWLIGVYDPARDAYVDFVDTSPSKDDPGRATREFVDWLAAEYDRPALVAWNGHEFDFEHLERFVAEYAPAFHEFWREDVFEYDLYDWAVRRDNAVLPGRTNRLEDVATALGRVEERDAEPIDGRTLGKRIRRLLESSSDDEDVDWNRARRYCEADIRELAAVHEAIEEADPEPARTESTDDHGTTQTGLTDF